MRSFEGLMAYSEKNPKFIIYGLFDPTSGAIRYVGKSCCGMSRAWCHMKPYTLNKKEHHTHKSRWITNLRSHGYMPKPVLLDVCLTKEATVVKEIQWIKDLRLVGAPLTNTTDGGDGTPGRKLSSETRKKISDKARGRPSSTKGRKFPGRVDRWWETLTPERSQKLSVAQKKRLSRPGELEKVRTQLAGVRETRKKPIVDDLGRSYPSIREAGRTLGIASPNIIAVLQGKYKQAGGRIFRFLNSKEIPI